MTSPANTSDRETGTVERLVAEMQAGLEGVTPGPWDWVIHDHSMASLGVLPDPGLGDPLVLAISPCRSCTNRAEPQVWKWGRCHTPSEADALHIARCSPDNIAAILSELTRLKARADALAVSGDNLIDDLVAKLDALEAKLATAREALATVRPIIRRLIQREHNVETWGLHHVLAEIDAAITEGADHERS